MLSLRLPKDIETRLERLAKKTGRSKTFYAREAILEHIEDLEDIYLAERVYANVRAGLEKTVPLTDVMKELGS